MSGDVVAKFQASLLEATSECSRIGYKPTAFIKMIHQHGGVEAVRSLLHNQFNATWFERLWAKQRLDLSVEAHILQPQWSHLFTPQERRIARDRLAGYQYTAPWDASEAASSPDAAIDGNTELGPFEPVLVSARPSGGMYGVIDLCIAK